MPVFAIAIGATNFAVGLISALPALINGVMQIPTAYYLEKRKRILSLLLKAAFLHRIFYLLLALLPLFLFPYHPVLFLLFILLLMNIPLAVVGVAWTSLMGKVIPHEKRIEVFARRNFYTGVATLLGTFFAGILLYAVGYPKNYSLLFAMSFVCVMISLFYLSKTVEKRKNMFHDSNLKSHLEDMLHIFGEDRAFRKLCMSSALFHAGLFLSLPIFSIYFVKELDFNNFQIGLLATSSSIASIATFSYWRKYSSRHGNRETVAMCFSGMVLTPILFVVIKSYPVLLLVNAFAGVCNAGLALALLNLLLDISAPKERPSYVALYNIFFFGVNFLGPLLGGFLAEFFQITHVLLLASIVRFMGFASFLTVKEPELATTRLLPQKYVFIRTLGARMEQGIRYEIVYFFRMGKEIIGEISPLQLLTEESERRD